MATPIDNHKTAVEQVNQWIVSQFEAMRELTDAELTLSPVSNAVKGWSIPCSYGGFLHIVLDKNFPYSEPRIVVVERPEILGGPHFETNGRICIAGSGGQFDTLKPVDVVAHIYQEALELLKGNEAKINDADFQHDFRAYWRREEQCEQALNALVELRGPSRKITSWSGPKIHVGDDAELLTRFLSNLRIASTVSLKPAFAIWLERLPRPDEYPENVNDLRRLVANNSRDGIRILDELLTNPTLPILGVLIGPAGGSRPPGIGGVSIKKKLSPSTPGRKIQDPLNKGFRPGKLPPGVIASRLQLTRMRVVEVDAAKSRRPSFLSSPELASKKVLMVGCGSLGSGVAKLLLQSGVRELDLIDPDTLGWENIERHELGGISVGDNKAKALAGDYRLKFPLARVSSYAKTWFDVYRENKQLFDASDLIVSTCADWNAESALSDLQQSGSLSAPVLYGWLEESALAAHVLVCDGSTPCFRCGFDATGTHLFPVVKASNGVPAGCGGGISLYSATDMAPAQAMITEAAVDILLGRAKALIHRVFLCSKPHLDAASGDWSPNWLQKYGRPPFGGTVASCAWPEKEGCPCRS